MEDNNNNKPELESLDDKITHQEEIANNSSEGVESKTELDVKTDIKESVPEVISKDNENKETISQPIIESNPESNNTNQIDQETKETSQSVAIEEPQKEEAKEEVPIDVNTEINNQENDNEANNNNENEHEQKEIIKEEEECKAIEIEPIKSLSKGGELMKDKDKLQQNSAIIEEEKEEESESQLQTESKKETNGNIEEKEKSKAKENKVEFFKPKTVAKKINSPKAKTTRNNKSEVYRSHNNSLMHTSIPSSPKALRTKRGIQTSNAKEKLDQHKQLNSTTIYTEDRPEISSTIKSAKKDDLFNSTYIRFKEKMKEKGDKINTLRKKMEEKEKNSITGVPKINKGKLTPNDSDFLTRQKAYEQKVKEKKDKLATEAKSKIDKEMNLASKQQKINKEEVNHRLIQFKEWEEKKKEKISHMKSELEKKAIEKINNGKLHKGAKCNIDDSCKRLYQDDVKKRQENKQLLQTMLKPAFKPTINSGKKKIQKDKEISVNNSDKGKYQALDKGSDKKKEVKYNDIKDKDKDKEREISFIEKMNTKPNDSICALEENSKILTTEFLTESNTDAFREKLFRNRNKFANKQDMTNQSVRVTQSFCLDE